VPGVQDSDCATVTVTLAECSGSAAASDAEKSDIATETILSDVSNCPELKVSWSYTANDEDNLYFGEGWIKIKSSDGTEYLPRTEFNAGGSGSGTVTIPESASGSLILEVDDGYGSADASPAG